MPVVKNNLKAKRVINNTSQMKASDNNELNSILLKEATANEDKFDDRVAIKPTDFVEFAVVIPDQETKILLPFSFEKRRYLKPMYNTTSPRVLLKCGRQVEKSTYLGNRLLSMTCIQPNFTSLYVSPTNQQTKTFSNDRIAEPLSISAKLKVWTDPHLAQNVFQKKFINRSQIVMRYAYLNADRVRGIPADLVCIDEIQDIHTDNIPVIEECIAHSAFKFKLYSGTPKSLDNTIESLWVEESTQNEWVVPCDSCGGGDYRYWNILDEGNIGPKYLICDRCYKQIYPMHEDAQWASMNPKPRVPHPMDGYRVPQIMVPWIGWDDILNKQLTYSRGKFHNEVLGLSYDSGTRPLTRADVKANCGTEHGLSRDDVARMKGLTRGGSMGVFMGVDWGTGEQSYTVVSICGYVGGKFTLMYIKRFEGQESEPQAQINLIRQLVKDWNVTLIGSDYGGGFDRNDSLIRIYGPRKVFKYQYSTVTSAKIKWDSGLGRFMLNRTEVMSDVFNAIKRRNIFRFPRWEDFEVPFGQDMLNIFSEYSESRRTNEYKKSRGVTDDAFHCLVYAILVSTLTNPRPDIFSNKKIK